MIKRVSLLITLLLLISCPLWAATTYYVANAGNNNCDGTSPTLGSSGACSWQTVAKVNGSSFSAGDSILFNRGDSWIEELIPPSSGSAGNPITFADYGSGTLPTLNGNNTLGTLILSSSKNYITFRNLRIINANGPGDGTIKIYQSSYNILDSLTINANASYFGIWLIDQTNHATVQNCTISNTSSPDAYRGSGIGDDTSATFGNNTIQNNTIFSNSGRGITSNLYSTGLTNLTIQNNIIYSNKYAGIGLSGNGTYPNNTIIQNNTLYGNVGVADVFEIDLYQMGNNNVTRYNLMHDGGFIATDGGGIRHDNAPTDGWGTGNQMYYNVIYNERTGIEILGSHGDNVYNNTIYNSTAYGVKINGGTVANVNIKNNLIHTAGTQLIYDEHTGTATVDYNFYYDPTLTNKWDYGASTYSTLGAWQAGSGHDTSSPVVANPLFTDTSKANFIPLTGSTAVRAGVGVSLTRDYLNRPVGTVPSIGAFELVPGSHIQPITGGFGVFRFSTPFVPTPTVMGQ